MERPEHQTWPGIIYGAIFGTLFASAMKIFDLLLYLICLFERGRRMRRAVEDFFARFDRWAREQEEGREGEEERVREMIAAGVAEGVERVMERMQGEV